MSDLFDDIANAEVTEGPQFESLPVGKWCAGRTATKENGKSAATVRTGTIQSGNRAGQTFYKFNVGLITMGGEPPVGQEHKGRYAFFSCFVEPGDRDTGPLAGRLVGFLNAVLSPGIALDEKDRAKRASARWRNTVKLLQETAQQNNITLDQYDGNKALFLAGLAVTALQEPARPILFKTMQRKRKDTGEKLEVEPGQIEDFVPDTVTKRKVKLFEEAPESPKSGTTF